MHHITMKDEAFSDTESKNIIQESLNRKGFSDINIKTIHPDIEDCYMYLDTLESTK